MTEDERRREAISSLREIGEVVLVRLEVPKLVGRLVYGLESRFVTVVANFESYQYPRPPIIRVQYPLWNYLTMDERYETVAHEHAHFVAFELYREKQHGEPWKNVMRRLGYTNPSATCRLNPRAQAHIEEKKASRKNGK